jgi:Kef-type K+ transport system membrane component KefB
MHLLPSLLLLLVFARLLGKAFKTLGHPEIIGEIIAGLLLGPVVLNLVHITPELSGIVQLSVFLLIFGAGLEMDLHEILDALKKKAFLSAAFGFFLPLGAGILIGQVFTLGLIESLCIGLCLAITALPIVLKMLSEFSMQDSSIGHTIVGAAIIIDIIALLLLGVVIDTPKDATSSVMLQSVGNTTLRLIFFFLMILLVNYYLRSSFLKVARTQKLYQAIVNTFGDEGVFGISLLFVLGFSTISEWLGLHFVIGAFFGGLLLNRDIMGPVFFKKLDATLGSVSNGFLTPIFFAFIGMQLSISAFQRLDLLLAIVGAGLLVKFFGSWIGARIAGIGARESVAMGVFLNSRGVLDLVVADLALDKEYISQQIFSSLVILGVVSTILVPFVYKSVVSKPSIEESEATG